MSGSVSLRIRYIRRSDLVALLVLALLTVAFLGYLAWGERAAAASDPRTRLAASGGARRYYLTQGYHDGDDVLAACAEGYHFASLWEIMDPSALKYDTDLGRVRDDSGQGPPTDHGWVRTGYASGDAGTPGRGNCNAWTSDLFEDSGAYVFLPSNWTAGDEDFLGWAVASSACSATRHVWCVADRVGASIYLPLVVRDHAA